ncbi:ferredoxin [Streptomyces sp. NBC_01089]|uniref:ferredoxin n=1 Tax=Streptomyces sp. NBC_01089 TaxID=2903747 RepID=UPI0038668782|nr:ferredoxin [Streptomyces sp. NBC_01089]
MRVTVNRERCVGSGNCVVNVPEVFDQDDEEGLVQLQVTEVPEGLRELVEVAAQLCPVGAIEVQHRVITK